MNAPMAGAEVALARRLVAAGVCGLGVSYVELELDAVPVKVAVWEVGGT